MAPSSSKLRKRLTSAFKALVPRADTLSAYDAGWDDPDETDLMLEHMHPGSLNEDTTAKQATAVPLGRDAATEPQLTLHEVKLRTHDVHAYVKAPPPAPPSQLSPWLPQHTCTGPRARQCASPRLPWIQEDDQGEATSATLADSTSRRASSESLAVASEASSEACMLL